MDKVFIKWASVLAILLVFLSGYYDKVVTTAPILFPVTWVIGFVCISKGVQLCTSFEDDEE